jgi:hypothetical protein
MKISKRWNQIIVLLLLWIVPLAAEESLTTPPSELPVKVEIAFFFLDLNKVDELSASFAASIYLNMTWKDPRLSFASDSEHNLHIFNGKEMVSQKLSEIWWPELEFEGTSHPEFTNMTLAIASDGSVGFKVGLTANFHNPLDFRHYPFDNQNLTIRISSFIWDTQVLEFVPLAQQDKFLEIHPKEFNDFHILNLRSEIKPIKDIGVTGEKEFSTFIAYIELKRNPTYTIYEFFLPLFIILIVTCSVFFLEVNDLGTRLTIITGSILVIVGTKFTIALNLPHVGYMTILDIVFFVSYLTGSIAVILCVIAFYLDKKDPQKAILLDSISWWTLPLLFIALSSIFIWMTI